MSQGWKALEWSGPMRAFIMIVFVAMSWPWPALAAGPQARVREILEAASKVYLHGTSGSGWNRAR
jgi:hypothetical protein